MKTLQILTTTAGILLALSATGQAAPRANHAYDAYASDRSGAYYYGPQGPQAYDAQAYSPRINTEPRASVQPQYQGQNLPYADRPYGDPDSW